MPLSRGRPEPCLMRATKAILVGARSNIGHGDYQYSFVGRPILVSPPTNIGSKVIVVRTRISSRPCTDE